MKFVKRFILVIVIFLAIVVVISLFLPSSFNIKRSIIVNADRELVFKQLNNLEKWEKWAPWVLKDSSIYLNQNNYSELKEGVGASFKWDSDNPDLGSGSMEITKSIPNDELEYKLNLGMGDIICGMFLSDTEAGINVEWTMDVEFGFNPLSKFFGLFMEGYVAPDYELGLKRLKSYAENLPKINVVKVKRESINNQWFLSIRDSVNQMEMTNIHGKIYAQINQFMVENDIEISDSPVVIYHFWSDSVVDIEAGFPINDSLFIDHELIKLNKIKAGNVVTAIHYGPYDRLIETYFGINEWMRKNKVVVTGPPWEKYITDPTTESNPEKWQTAVYFPIE